MATTLKNVYLSGWTLHQLQLLSQKTKTKREVIIHNLLNEYVFGSAYVHTWDDENECYVQSNLAPYVLPKIPQSDHRQVKFFVDDTTWHDIVLEAKRRGLRLPIFVDRVIYRVATDHNNPRQLTELEQLDKTK